MAAATRARINITTGLLRRLPHDLLLVSEHRPFRANLAAFLQGRCVLLRVTASHNRKEVCSLLSNFWIKIFLYGEPKVRIHLPPPAKEPGDDRRHQRDHSRDARHATRGPILPGARVRHAVWR